MLLRTLQCAASAREPPRLREAQDSLAVFGSRGWSVGFLRAQFIPLVCYRILTYYHYRWHHYCLDFCYCLNALHIVSDFDSGALSLLTSPKCRADPRCVAMRRSMCCSCPTTDGSSHAYLYSRTCACRACILPR